MSNSCTTFVDPLVQPFRCTARIASMRTAYVWNDSSAAMLQHPTSMRCHHVNSDGNLANTALHVLSFKFVQEQATPTNAVAWLIQEPQGNVQLFTDERDGLRMHVVFSDPNDALLFKLTFADILERV